MAYKIVQVRDHYEVYINGQFYCSADTWSEAETEIKTYQNQGDVVSEI